MLTAAMLALIVLVAAPALAQGGSGSGGGSASGGGSGSGGGSASQAPAPADETPAVDTLAEEAAEEAGERTSGAADETPAVDTPAEEAAEEAAEAGSVPKTPAQQSGKLPSSGGISPVALVSVAVLISGAALGVVVLRRRG
jgi:hypothetical protein